MTKQMTLSPAAPAKEGGALAVRKVRAPSADAGRARLTKEALLLPLPPVRAVRALSYVLVVALLEVPDVVTLVTVDLRLSEVSLSLLGWQQAGLTQSHAQSSSMFTFMYASYASVLASVPLRWKLQKVRVTSQAGIPYSLGLRITGCVDRPKTLPWLFCSRLVVPP